MRLTPDELAYLGLTAASHVSVFNWALQTGRDLQYDLVQTLVDIQQREELTGPLPDHWEPDAVQKWEIVQWLRYVRGEYRAMLADNDPQHRPEELNPLIDVQSSIIRKFTFTVIPGGRMGGVDLIGGTL